MLWYVCAVDMNTAQPYWVDHINKDVSMVPPSAIGLIPVKQECIEEGDEDHDAGDGGVMCDDGELSQAAYLLDTLPEYIIHAHRLTQLLEMLDKLNVATTRCRARINPSSFQGKAAARTAIETSIIDSAHIVFTTLNSAGHPSLEATEFCVTVIDEVSGCETCLVVLMSFFIDHGNTYRQRFDVFFRFFLVYSLYFSKCRQRNARSLRC